MALEACKWYEHIYLDRLRPPTRSIFTVPQDSQKHRLARRRQMTDLIEKQCPAVCLLKIGLVYERWLR
jgi:hypothetical protein